MTDHQRTIEQADRIRQMSVRLAHATDHRPDHPHPDGPSWWAELTPRRTT